MKKEDLGIDEKKTHYYESNSPTKVEDWFSKMKTINMAGFVLNAER